MSDYINFSKEKGNIINFSDIVYNEQEYINFSKWFESSIKPFDFIEFDIGNYSITLDQNYYEYDWLSEKKVQAIYGDGHDYENAFKIFVNEELYYLNSSLEYDSENGMFCVRCNDIEKAIELIYELSCLYKNENKMVELIRKTKNIDYNVGIKI